MSECSNKWCVVSVFSISLCCLCSHLTLALHRSITDHFCVIVLVEYFVMWTMSLFFIIINIKPSRENKRRKKKTVSEKNAYVAIQKLNVIWHPRLIDTEIGFKLLISKDSCNQQK